MRHDTATTAEAATSTFEGHSRTKAGEVAWHTGNLAQKTWTENARKRQNTFYGSIDGARSTAKSVANNMSVTSGYDQPATLAEPFASNTVNTTIMVANAAGAAKALAAAVTTRDTAATGTPINMPAARTQSTNAGEEWKMTWTTTMASMQAWKNANSTPGAVSLWWAAAR